MLAGKAVMINWSDVAPEHRPAYYEWHSREHMVGRVAIPGYQRGRRYLAAQAERDFLVLYEVDDLSVVTGPDYLAKANKPSPLTQRTTPFVKNSVRGLAPWSGVLRHRYRRLRAHAALRSARRRRGRTGPLPDGRRSARAAAAPAGYHRARICSSRTRRRAAWCRWSARDVLRSFPTGSSCSKASRSMRSTAPATRISSAAALRRHGARDADRAGYLQPAAHGAAAGRLRGSAEGAR